MIRTIEQRRNRLLLISAFIALIGLGSAVAIYLVADDDAEGGPGYEVVGNKIYPAMQERSKKYRHELELYGGKAAVLADEFNRWFDGLWRGRTLAFTVAALSWLVAFGFFVAARNVHPHGNAVDRQDREAP